MQYVPIMRDRQNVLRFASREVYDAPKFRKTLEASLQHCQDRQAELRLTIMETQIRLADVTATLRRLSYALR